MVDGDSRELQRHPRLSTALRMWLLVSMVALVVCGLIGTSGGSTTVGLGFGVSVIGLFTVMTSSHYSSTLRSGRSGGSSPRGAGRERSGCSAAHYWSEAGE